MLFKSSLYITLIIFLCGLAYKVSTWFFYDLEIHSKRYTTSRRVLTALKSIVLTLLSTNIVILIKAFILDVLLQRRIFKESILRWSMHLCIFYGFIFLLLIHALENIISSNIFPNYSSTLNPFLFLRTFFGIMVIAGLCISFYRRHILKIPRLINNTMDHYMVIILATIIVTGFLLEATKITSYSSYQIMVEDYADFDDDESLSALESYWVDKYGVVSPDIKGPFTTETITLGEELHEMSCAACHSRPQWAFISYGIVTAIKPIALKLDKAGVHIFFRYIHFYACLLALVYLPFSRLFHMFTSPLCLLINTIMDNKKSDPVNIVTKQMLELDACTHCGTCSVQCLVGITYEELHNVNILPSEKLASVKKLAAGKKLMEEDITNIQQGLYLCTNCNRCTLVCPSGINLRELWFNVREVVLRGNHPEGLLFSPLSMYRGLRSNEINHGYYKKPLEQLRRAIAQKYSSFGSMETPIYYNNGNQYFIYKFIKSVQANTILNCYGCFTCSSVCPVVDSFNHPPNKQDLTPHQIIHAVILGLPDIAFRSRMLWSCLGCYQCQEACPQGVHITDIFYELKNMAMAHLKGNINHSIEKGT